MDYYKILGVNPGASEDDVKQAYRKLASKHHPDKGGNTERFQEIQAAYDAIISGRARQEQFQNNNFDFGDIFGNNSAPPFGFNFNFGSGQDINDFIRRSRKPIENPPVTVNYEVTLEQVFSGIDEQLRVSVPNRGEVVIPLKLDPGFQHGIKVRYPQQGVQMHTEAPPGDVYVQIGIRPHSTYKRDHNNLYTQLDIPLKTALMGGTIEINTIDGKTLAMNVPAGTQPQTVMRVGGYGLRSGNHSTRGDMLVTVNIIIPKITDGNTKIIDLPGGI